MFLNPHEVVSHLSLGSDSRVADFGAGKGEHALLMARRLAPRGAVYALERHGGHIEALARRSAAENLGNLFPVRVDLEQHIPLTDGLLSAALVSNTLHALKTRERFVAELYRLLAPGAPCLVVDWAHSFGNMGPPAEDVVYPADAVRLFRAQGFSTGDMLPAGSHHFAFIATKVL